MTAFLAGKLEACRQKDSLQGPPMDRYDARHSQALMRVE